MISLSREVQLRAVSTDSLVLLLLLFFSNNLLNFFATQPPQPVKPVTAGPQLIRAVHHTDAPTQQGKRCEPPWWQLQQKLVTMSLFSLFNLTFATLFLRQGFVSQTSVAAGHSTKTFFPTSLGFLCIAPIKVAIRHVLTLNKNQKISWKKLFWWRLTALLTPFQVVNARSTMNELQWIVETDVSFSEMNWEQVDPQRSCKSRSRVFHRALIKANVSSRRSRPNELSNKIRQQTLKQPDENPKLPDIQNDIS